MQRGSDKHGPMLDDQLQEESEPLTRGSPAEARADEGREKEGGPGEDEPTPDRRLQGDRGLNRYDFAESENLEWRHEIQRHLQGSVFPARRDELLASAQEMQAPEHVMDLLRALSPDKTYGTLKEVWTDLGGAFEEEHM